MDYSYRGTNKLKESLIHTRADGSVSVPILIVGENGVKQSIAEYSVRPSRKPSLMSYNGGNGIRPSERPSVIDKLRETLHQLYGKDMSPEAKTYRLVMWVRSVYAEFICTCIYFTAVFGCMANAYLKDWSPEAVTLIGALVSSLGVVAVTFAFSDLSGAQMNPVISFALWFTGRLSNRKFISYVLVQLLASLFSTGIVGITFPMADVKMYNFICVHPDPTANGGHIFATEFVCTFVLTYVAFTVAFEEIRRLKKERASIKTINHSEGLVLYASTPQSKSGFAPFSIGFTVFFLSCYGGSSGVSMNPVRMLGPAVFAGYWEYFWMYVIAEFIGAGMAAWIVTIAHKHINPPSSGDSLSDPEIGGPSSTGSDNNHGESPTLSPGQRKSTASIIANAINSTSR